MARARRKRLAPKTSISANFADDPAKAELDAETFPTEKAILQLPLIEPKGMRNFSDSGDALSTEIGKHVKLYLVKMMK